MNFVRELLAGERDSTLVTFTLVLMGGGAVCFFSQQFSDKVHAWSLLARALAAGPFIASITLRTRNLKMQPERFTT